MPVTTPSRYWQGKFGLKLMLWPMFRPMFRFVRRFGCTSSLWRRIFGENSISADLSRGSTRVGLDEFTNGTVVADNNELPATFQKVKSARIDFLDKPGTADFVLDPEHGTAHDTALGHCSGGKYLINPVRGKALVAGLHRMRKRQTGLRSG